MHKRPVVHDPEVVSAAKRFTHAQLRTGLKPGETYFEVPPLRRPEQLATVPRADGVPRAEGETFRTYDRPYMKAHEERKLLLARHPLYQFIVALAGAIPTSDISRLYNVESLESKKKRDDYDRRRRDLEQKNYDAAIGDLRARSNDLKAASSAPLHLELDELLAARRRLMRQVESFEWTLVTENMRAAGLEAARELFVQWAEALRARISGDKPLSQLFAENPGEVAAQFRAAAAKLEQRLAGSPSEMDRYALRKAFEYATHSAAIVDGLQLAKTKQPRVYTDADLRALADTLKTIRDGTRAAGVETLRYALAVEKLSDPEEAEEIDLESLYSDDEEEEDEEEEEEEADDDGAAGSSSHTTLRGRGYPDVTRDDLLRLARFCIDYTAAVREAEDRRAPQLALRIAPDYGRAVAELNASATLRPCDFADLVSSGALGDSRRLLTKLRGHDIVVFSTDTLRAVQRAIDYALQVAASKLSDAPAGEAFANVVGYRNPSQGFAPDQTPVGIASEIDRANRAAALAAQDLLARRSDLDATRSKYRSVERDWKAADERQRQLESEIERLEEERRAALAELERLGSEYQNNYQWMARPENSGLVDLDEKVVFGLMEAFQIVKCRLVPAPTPRTDEQMLDALMTSEDVRTQFAKLTASRMTSTAVLGNREWTDLRTLPYKFEEEEALKAFFRDRVYWQGDRLRVRSGGTRAAFPAPSRRPVSQPTW